MTLHEARDIAKQLNDMSTTGEDFLAGHNGEVVIERWLDKESLDIMAPQEAIAYALAFAADGAKKCLDALEFLIENGIERHQLISVLSPLRKALEIMEGEHECQRTPE